MAGRRVIVVGAGFAGLEAARRLAAAGCEVTLLEREAAAGGRVLAQGPGSTSCDAAGFVHSREDATLAALLRALGRGGALEPWPPGALTQLGPDGPVAISPCDLAGVARVPGVGWLGALRLPRLARLLARFAPLLDASAPERAARLDDRSVREFARLYFGTRASAAWIEPMLRHAAHQDAREASRLLFFLRPGLGSAAGPASLRVSPRALATAMAGALATHFGVESLAVEPADHGQLRLRCAHRAGTGETPEVDAVVLATPPGAALRIADGLLTSAERDFLRGARFVPALALALGLRRPVGGGVRRLIVPASAGLPLAAIALEGAGTTDDGGGARAVVFADADFARSHAGAADDVVAKALGAAAEQALPGLMAATIDTSLCRWPLALPSFPVGRFREIGRFHRVQRDRRAAGRRLYFAGDWLVAPSVEGALASGARAASALLADLAGA